MLSRENTWYDAASNRLTEVAVSGAGIAPANSGNSENTPMMISSARPPARRSASSTSTQVSTAAHIIHGAIRSGALYSQPPAADSRAVRVHSSASAVPSKNSAASYQGTRSMPRPARAG